MNRKMTIIADWKEVESFYIPSKVIYVNIDVDEPEFLLLCAAMFLIFACSIGSANYNSSP